MQEDGERFAGLYGAYRLNGGTAKEITDNMIYQFNIKENKEEIYENGDIMKFKEVNNGKKGEWVFSPRVGWNDIPEEASEEMKSCNCMWDYLKK
jgi:hypothetical protein